MTTEQQMTAIKLLRCLDAAEEALADCLAKALQELPPGSLPLRAGCNQGGLVDDSEIRVSVLGTVRGADRVTARVGIFFSELVGGCNCSDDPVAANAYCLLEVVVGRGDGRVEFTPLEA